MVEAMVKRAIERATDGSSDFSGSYRRVRAMDQEAIEKAMDGSEINRRSDGCCKRWISEQ